MIYHVHGTQYIHRIKAKESDETYDRGNRHTDLRQRMMEEIAFSNFDNNNLQPVRITYCQRLIQALSAIVAQLVSLWNSFCPCTCVWERNLGSTSTSLTATPLASSVSSLPENEDIAHSSHLKRPSKKDKEKKSLPEKEWTKSLMSESIYARNQRLNNCYIPQVETITNYLDAVRKHSGKYHSDIKNAASVLNRNSDNNMKNSNYDNVLKGDSMVAYHEAILLHEIMMFEGLNALFPPSEEDQHYEDDVKDLPLEKTACILGKHFLGLFKDYTMDEIVKAYSYLEDILNSFTPASATASTPTDDLSLDVDIIMQQLHIPNRDIRPLICALLKDGRTQFVNQPSYAALVSACETEITTLDEIHENRSDDESSVNTQALPHSEKKSGTSEKRLSRTDEVPLSTPSEIDENDCIICYAHCDIKTLCCGSLICPACFSTQIVETGKRGYDYWEKHDKMPACLSCDKSTPMAKYIPHLSAAAKTLLDSFEQQYMQHLYTLFSNVALVPCSASNCSTQYLITNPTKIYFQCDKVSCHPNHRVILHHIACGMPWTFSHNAVCPENSTIQLREEMVSLQNLITNIDTVKQCPNSNVSDTREQCNMMVYRDGGCNHITCPGCRMHFCWFCEKKWEDHMGSFYECSYPTKIIEVRNKHLTELNKKMVELKKEYKIKTGREYTANAYSPPPPNQRTLTENITASGSGV